MLSLTFLMASSCSAVKCELEVLVRPIDGFIAMDSDIAGLEFMLVPIATDKTTVSFVPPRPVGEGTLHFMDQPGVTKVAWKGRRCWTERATEAELGGQ